MSKHTPGPWKQDKYGHVRTMNGEAVPFGSVTLAMYNSDEIRANDRLACSAPELLEALIAIEKKYSEITNWEYAGRQDQNPEITRPLATQARAAIAKATQP